MEQINIDALYRELKSIHESMVTKEELGRFLETILILSNKKTMQQIEASEKDIASGRVKRIHSIHDI